LSWNDWKGWQNIGRFMLKSFFSGKVDIYFLQLVFRYVLRLLTLQIPGLPYVNPLLGNLLYIMSGEAMERSIEYVVFMV